MHIVLEGEREEIRSLCLGNNASDKSSLYNFLPNCQSNVVEQGDMLTANYTVVVFTDQLPNPFIWR